MTYTRTCISIYTCKANSVSVHIQTYKYIQVGPNMRPYINTHIAVIAGGFFFQGGALNTRDAHKTLQALASWRPSPPLAGV